MQKQSRLTTYILGPSAHHHRLFRQRQHGQTGEFADYMALITTLFLRLIKMIIAPLVFSTLVCGIAKMGDARKWAASA
jgi:Na+/H+-dicarboxylate symporter